MDAHAYLLSLGWAGPGHSLDSQPYKQKGHRGLAYDPAKVGNNGNGLVKPLGISQRQGRFGIGKKSHEPQAGNEWWLKGFESALGNIGKSESERSSGSSTPVSRGYAGKHGGLFTFFVKGQQMQGTIGKAEDIKRQSKKRKSEVLDTNDAASQSIEPERQKSTAEFEQAEAFFALRDKDEKRRQRVEKQSPVEEFQQVGEYLEARSDKMKRKSEAVDSELNVPLDTSGAGDKPGRDETKEESRERRRRRKDENEQRRKVLADLANQQQLDLKVDSDEKDTAVKAARKAERKRRKGEMAIEA